MTDEQFWRLRSFGGHTLDVELLKFTALGYIMSVPRILDVGSRGNQLKDALYETGFVPRLTAVDPDENVEDALHVALIGAGEVTQTYARFSTGEGNHLGSGYGIADCHPIAVPCMTIAGLSRVLGVKHWDAVKLDCEGAEFGILENWPGPIATQISVEFHDYLDPHRWNDDYFRWLFSRLADYDVIQHNATRQGDQLGHWDSLLVLKEEKRKA